MLKKALQIQIFLLYLIHKISKGDSMKRLVVSDYTKPELDKIRELANFTDDELQCFELKAKDKSLVEISLAMNTSTTRVSSIFNHVVKKINKLKQGGLI